MNKKIIKIEYYKIIFELRYFYKYFDYLIGKLLVLLLKNIIFLLLNLKIIKSKYIYKIEIRINIFLILNKLKIFNLKVIFN